MTRYGLLTLGMVAVLSAVGFAQDPIPSSARGQINLNGAWQTNASILPSPIPTSGWTPARVPEPPISNGTVALWYQDSIYLPSSWFVSSRRWFLNFDQIAHYAAVYLNGQLIGTHYGQYSPISIEVTPQLLVGTNAIDVYVHDSDSVYAYPFAHLNQSKCTSGGYPANCQALSYRPAATSATMRNWIGIAGDVSLSWRPSGYVQSVVTVPSVRNSTLSAAVSVAGSGTYTIQASVLDGSDTVLSLPAQDVQGGSSVTLSPTNWSNPTLWGPPGYGQPKLYTFETQLLQNGSLVDTEYDTFGFREVWIAGQQLMLNGVALRVVGDNNQPLAPMHTANDRRPLAAQYAIYQTSGLNTYENHWDQDPVAYQLADEMGMLIEGAMFCNGALPQSEADSQTAWTNFMVPAVTAWVQKYANHPSIVIWRPFDVLPPSIQGQTFEPQAASVIAANDPQSRPIADGGTLPQSIDFWSQDVQGTRANTCASLTPLQNSLAAETRPLYVKEVYGGQQFSCAPGFFSAMYGFMSTYPAMVGLMAQQMNFNEQSNFAISWESQSGIGNRPASQEKTLNGMLPNWLGSWTPTTWSTQFASLDPWPITVTAPLSGDFETSAPTGTVLAVLTPASGTQLPPSGVTADGGSVWWVVPWTGSGTATYYDGQSNVLSTQTVSVQSPLPY